MDQELEYQELNGTVETVIYKNEENGYTVLKLRSDSGEAVTVVGCFPFAAPGESMIASGEWMNHSVHGRQFKAEYAQRFLPSSAPAIYQFLAGGAVKGVGPATASLIVDRFGDRTLDTILNNWKELTTVKGISAAKAQQISKSFRQQAGLRMLMEFVCSFGLRPILALRAYKYYGDDALQNLRDNPYLLCSSLIGGTFREADEMALGLGVGGNSKNRISAAILFELVHNMGNGHCFIPREKLAAVTAELIGVEQEEADECIGELIEDNQLRYEEIAGVRACYLPALYEAEKNAAETFARMSRRKFRESVNTEKLLQKLETQQGITYAPDQRQTLEQALSGQLMVLTGGPGTGKTTCIRAILAMYDSLGLKTLLCAPTGRAAKRMTEVTGREAATVHRLLGAKFDEEGDRVVFTKNESDRLDCDAVILDECSMVDILLMDALLRALPPDARLVLVGDADQLPSVGPGNVFSALIRSQVVATGRLTLIHRQAEGSRIVRNAHMIKNGEYPNFAENAGDFFRLKRLQGAGAVETITELCAVRLPNKMNIPPEEIQVLSPTRKGETGTMNLNRKLQEALNPPAPGKKEKAFGDVVFREGDRVMQIRNNYDILWKNANNTEAGMGIYNGDMGILRTVDPENETLTVDFDGRIVCYGFDALNELEHAWAVTVHKAQGSEYRAVILALSGTSQLLMTRSVLYTGVTRARELLILVGDDTLAIKMIDNYRQARRYTALRVRLRSLCGL